MGGYVVLGGMSETTCGEPYPSESSDSDEADMERSGTSNFDEGRSGSG